MSSRLPVYRTHTSIFFVFFAAVLTVIVIVLFVGVTEVAFQKIEFTRLQVVLILVGTFLGSSVNIPVDV